MRDRDDQTTEKGRRKRLLGAQDQVAIVRRVLTRFTLLCAASFSVRNTID
jgi:hypothetical protein